MDSPGTLHHVMVRGLERGAIATEETNREQICAHLGKVAAAGTANYAWAIVLNHCHLLLRSGPIGLLVFIRRWLTGYAITFNRRHQRVGHLFQNRYKLIVCGEDAYFRELVRCIHLSSLHAGLVASLRALDRYLWCGHAAVLGCRTVSWQEQRSVLDWFGRSKAQAVRGYRAYVAAGEAARPSARTRGRRARAVSGRLGGRAGHAPPETGRPSRSRILGHGDFVERLLQEAGVRQRPRWGPAERAKRTESAIRAACARAGITLDELAAGSRRGPIPVLRAIIANELITRLGLSVAEAARRLGVTTSAVSRAVRQPGLE